MQKYFDFVSEKLFEENNIDFLEDLFLSLHINTVYITRFIKTKNNLNKEFKIPKSKNIIFKKAYLFNNISLSKNNKVTSLFLGQTLQNNNSVVNSKNKILFDVISESLSFDESSVKLSYKNHIKILFNFNNWRNKKQSKAIKQSLFIIPLLKNNLVDMLFCSMAEKPDELIDFNILKNFLKNFDLSENLISRFLNEKILK